MNRALLAGVLIGWALAVPAAVPQADEMRTPEVTSSYVAMRDGTRLALDVWLPSGRQESRVPTVLQLTRYWRALRKTGRPPFPDAYGAIEFFAKSGYAVVVVDVRGTGASFGARATEFSDIEVQDTGEIIDWIARQSWSNERVATLGSSYLGNSAELATIPARPALRAVVPRFTDFSEYRHAVRPGGVRNNAIANVWVDFTRGLDRNDGCAAFAGGVECGADAPWSAGVKPVDEDADGALLEAAVREHARSVDLRSIVSRLVFADDPFGENPGITLESVSPSTRWRAIDRAGVPAYHWASWFDGGTADGVLERFSRYNSPLKIVIGAWTHGGGLDANPYRDGSSSAPSSPTPATQFEMILDFLDPLMRDDVARPPNRSSEIAYLTLGTNAWRTTNAWPPQGVSPQPWYLHEGHEFRPDKEVPTRGSDSYEVDFAASTGIQNRWHTQLGAPVNYDSSSDVDGRRLAYTSGPLTRDMEITGTPRADLWISTTTSDGAIFVYLEDVAPDERVTYLTEGQRRLLFPANASSLTQQDAPELTDDFARAVARPPIAGQLRRYMFDLHPISVVLARGHRLRLAIAGADADTFEHLPVEGTAPRFAIARNRSNPSCLILPVRQ